MTLSMMIFIIKTLSITILSTKIFSINMANLIITKLSISIKNETVRKSEI
jgi:hypothetical protein